jgi:serine/threonine protein kinase/Tfp pilus assembly protein PilF
MNATAGTEWAWGQLDRFEADARRDPATDLADYLPPADHPNHLEALTELARLDMELAERRGEPRPPSFYFARFPALEADPTAAAGVILARNPAGAADDEPRTVTVPDSELPSGESNLVPRVNSLAALTQAVPGLVNPLAALTQAVPVLVDSAFPLPARPPQSSPIPRRPNVPLPRPVDVADTPPPSSAWPQVGDLVAGFRLTGELGKGAFGRVFLARQGDLANRSVALKLGIGLVGESHTLARLQHTNIVPIYSAHQSGRMQVVCMPFLGRITLAHLIGQLRASGPLMPQSVRHLIETFRPNAEGTHPNSAPSDTPSSVFGSTDGVPAPQPQGGFWDRLTTGTLADAVAWAVAQLAGGLGHAHERGILHRDIKPANVLVTDDGVPMLLDFNLADDANAEHALRSASVGGTLPYMAPEQLAAFDNYLTRLDARTDLFGLGVLLYELLTGVRPYPERNGSLSTLVAAMTADRRTLPPPVRVRNPFVRPSLEAVVFKLLSPNPAKRYHTAADVAEDLHRYLARLPLKQAPNPCWRERLGNWVARHPRIVSSGTVGGVLAAVAVAAVGGGLALREHTRTLEARVAFDTHARELSGVQSLLDDRGLSRPQLDDALARSERTLAKYGLKPDVEQTPAEWERHELVRYLPAADRDRLREQVGEFYFLLGRAAYQRAKMADLPGVRAAAVADAERWNRQAEAFGGVALARAVGEQRADLLRIAGRTADADAQAAAAAQVPPGSARDRFLLGFWRYQRGQLRGALPDLSAATSDDPANFSAWFVLGTTHLNLNEPDLAAMAFTACIALRPDFAPAHLNRGLALVRLGKAQLAVENFDAAIKFDPKPAEYHFLRAGALAQLGQSEEAEKGYTAALACADCPPRVYLYRAAVRDALGDVAGAKADRFEGGRRDPTDAVGWVARAENIEEADPKQALAFVNKALDLNPLDATALQLKSHLLSECLNKPAEAIAVLDRALEHYPEHVQCLGGRAVLKARNGDRDGAHADATLAVRLNADGPTLYQAGCVFALTAKGTPADRFKAVELLNAAVKVGFGREHLGDDPDLNPIRESTEFKEFVRDAGPKKGD